MYLLKLTVVLGFLCFVQLSPIPNELDTLADQLSGLGGLFRNLEQQVSVARDAFNRNLQEQRTAPVDYAVVTSITDYQTLLRIIEMKEHLRLFEQDELEDLYEKLEHIRRIIDPERRNIQHIFKKIDRTSGGVETRPPQPKPETKDPPKTNVPHPTPEPEKPPPKTTPEYPWREPETPPKTTPVQPDVRPENPPEKKPEISTRPVETPVKTPEITPRPQDPPPKEETKTPEPSRPPPSKDPVIPVTDPSNPDFKAMEEDALNFYE